MDKTPQELIDNYMDLAENALWDIAIRDDIEKESRIKTFINAITQAAALKGLLKMQESLKQQNSNTESIGKPELELDQIVTLVIYDFDDLPDKEEKHRIKCKIVQRVYDYDSRQCLYKGHPLEWSLEFYEIGYNMPFKPIENYLID